MRRVSNNHPFYKAEAMIQASEVYCQALAHLGHMARLCRVQQTLISVVAPRNLNI